MCAFYDEKNKLWSSSEQKEVKDPECSMGRVFLNLLSAKGSKVAQINDDTGVQATFHDLWLWTVRAAQNLLQRGFHSRQVFGFIAENSDHLVPMYLASICLACPIVPLHSTLSVNEIRNVLTKTKPSVIFCDTEAHDKLTEALNELKLNAKIFIFGEGINDSEPVENLLIETGKESDFVPFDTNNEIAGIFCSSGTTGPSKCTHVLYSHSMFTEPAIHDPDSVVFTFESIYWTVGVDLINECIHSGVTRIITSKPYSPKLLFKLIESYKITILHVIPFYLIRALKNDLINEAELSSLNEIHFYGSKMPYNLVAELLHHIPNASLTSWYGLTEVGVVSVSLLHVPDDNGGERLTEGCSVKIVDDAGNRAGPNVNGEIYVKKRFNFPGYYGNPNATAAAIDDEEFFRTGDIGHFNENGLLFIEDRKKDVIHLFYHLTTIPPFDIEKVLIQLPDIQDVCVVGIPIVLGAQLPAALVVRKPNSNLNQRDVYKTVADNCPDELKLRGGVYFVDSLPRTHNGKLIRKEITQLATTMFQSAKEYDADIQAYLLDFPDELRGFF